MRKYILLVLIVIFYFVESSYALVRQEDRDQLIFLFPLKDNNGVVEINCYLDMSTIYKDGYIVTWGERFVLTEEGRAIYYDLINNPKHTQKEIDDLKNEAFSIHYNHVNMQTRMMWLGNVITIGKDGTVIKVSNFDYVDSVPLDKRYKPGTLGREIFDMVIEYASKKEAR